MKVNGKDDVLYIMENKTCLKPPTSNDWNNSSTQVQHVFYMFRFQVQGCADLSCRTNVAHVPSTDSIITFKKTKNSFNMVLTAFNYLGGFEH